MIISETGFKFLEEVEGLKLQVYPDSGGEPTIGIGHLLTQSEKSSGKIRGSRYENGITEEQAYFILHADLDRFEKAVNGNVLFPLAQHRYDALVCFAFNVGVEAFTNSTLLRKVNAKEYLDIPAQFRRWIRSKGKIITGLINRREHEIKLWNNEWDGCR